MIGHGWVIGHGWDGPKAETLGASRGASERVDLTACASTQGSAARLSTGCRSGLGWGGVGARRCAPCHGSSEWKRWLRPLALKTGQRCSQSRQHRLRLGAAARRYTALAARSVCGTVGRGRWRRTEGRDAGRIHRHLRARHGAVRHPLRLRQGAGRRQASTRARAGGKASARAQAAPRQAARQLKTYPFAAGGPLPAHTLVLGPHTGKVLLSCAMATHGHVTTGGVCNHIDHRRGLRSYRFRNLDRSPIACASCAAQSLLNSSG